MNDDLSFGAVSGVQLVLSMDMRDFVSLFWFMIIFELPRYFVGAVVFLIFSLRLRVTPARRSVDQDLAGAAHHDARKFSVIVACHNEAGVIHKCVQSIWEQTAMLEPTSGARLGEIVVVDDGSTDDTAAVMADLRKDGLIDTGLSLQLRGGKSAATNLALAYCRNPFIIVADVDTTFDRDAFAQLLQPFDDETTGAVGGNLFVRNVRNSLTTIYQDIEYRITISLGRRISEMLDILGIVSGAFGAFRRAALDAVGGFDVEIGEDADLTMKLRQAGWHIAFQPRAYAGTDVPETVPKLIRQRLRWDHSVVTIWLRKYDHLLNPFRADFRLANALVVFDVFFLQVVISGAFFVYIGWLVSTVGWFALVIISATLFVYFLIAVVMLLIASLADERRQAAPLLLYLPYFVVFGCFVMRAIRLYSALDEWVFRSSYHDSYVPRRVMREVERY